MEAQNAEIHPVFAVLNKLVAEVEQIANGDYTHKKLKKETEENRPVNEFVYDDEEEDWRCLMFDTLRRKESVKVVITAKKLETRFHPGECPVEDSDEYCLDFYIYKRQAPMECLRQEFSLFLATDKHMIDFILESVWPHIDASEEIRLRRIARRFGKLPPKPKPKPVTRERRYNAKYPLRPRKDDESGKWKPKNSREERLDRRDNRRLLSL